MTGKALIDASIEAFVKSKNTKAKTKTNSNGKYSINIEIDSQKDSTIVLTVSPKDQNKYNA